jgi:Flp pilus assembly pilin Flp
MSLPAIGGMCALCLRKDRDAAKTRGSESGTTRKGGSMMTSLMKKLVTDDAGQDLAEYGIALAVIGVIAAAAAIVIAKDVGSLWTRAQSVIDSAATAS